MVSSPLVRVSSPGGTRHATKNKMKALLTDPGGLASAVSTLSAPDTATVLELCGVLMGHLRTHMYRLENEDPGPSLVADVAAPPRTHQLPASYLPGSPVLAPRSGGGGSSPAASAGVGAGAGGAAAATLLLTDLPNDVLTRVVSWLPTVEDIGRADCVCRAFHRGDSAPPPPPPPPISPVEEALRQRAAASGHRVPSELPDGESSWIQKLCWDERRRRHGERAVVAGGMYHSAFVRGDGALLTCGNSTLDGGRPGLLGHGESVERLQVPTVVPALRHVRIRSLAAGEYHTVAIAEGGAAYSWGYGGLGRLGHGDERDRFAPTEVVLPRLPAPSSAGAAAANHAAVGMAPGGDAPTAAACADRGVFAAAAGHCHTLLLTGAPGFAFSCGYGGSGRLGLGEGIDDTRQLAPRPIEALAGVPLLAVSAGAFHTLLLTAGGEVYSCGDGGLGQLGHGDALRNEYTPRRVESLGAVGARVCAIGAGRVHSLCITEDGHAYSWGEGDEGRLGHGDDASSSVPRLIRGLLGRRVCSISCVWDHSAALTDGGRVYSWGLGMCGQLGHGDEEESVHAPRQVEALAATKVVAIAAGAHHCFAVAADGCLFGWGIGSTTEDDAVDTLGLKLDGHQCLPVQYDGLRVSRPFLPRTWRTSHE